MLLKKLSLFFPWKLTYNFVNKTFMKSFPGEIWILIKLTCTYKETLGMSNDVVIFFFLNRTIVVECFCMRCSSSIRQVAGRTKMNNEWKGFLATTFVCTTMYIYYGIYIGSLYKNIVIHNMTKKKSTIRQFHSHLFNINYKNKCFGIFNVLCL